MSTYFNGICHNIDDCAKKLKTALFMVGEIGGNDITMHFFQGKTIEEVREIVPKVVQAIKDAVTGMNNFSTYHSDQLRRALDAASLQKSCCGVGDDYDFSLIKMCGAPGATVCPNPDERISWDRVHLTQKAYQYMANWLINDILPNLQCK
ncbi:GDSL esterase/lipase At5g03980-like [Quercus lobata]|uniref:GDSL esterase/lipase At5g03980-like n=1 Tax=Quercus lobata TaxID=97700 RepID=UPI001245B672|nr:GDSL esterase/lipase At5g03980-like [Quercus lobata]